MGLCESLDRTHPTQKSRSLDILNKNFIKKRQDLVAKVDMDGSGLLNFPEFLAMMGYKVSQANLKYKIHTTITSNIRDYKSKQGCKN